MKRILFVASIGLILLSSCSFSHNKQAKENSEASNEVVDSTNNELKSDTSNASADDEANEEPKSFVDQTDWKDVTCEEYTEDDGYTNIQKCTFPNATMKQVYDIIKKFDDNLKDALPTKNIAYTSEEYDYIKVSYKYKTPNDLLIEVEYAGGVSTFEITQTGKSTVSKIMYSADYT